MPGTIQVSVLDFKGLSSSSPPSALSIKISMGKREFKTWDKGDFSFPLTTLRDNLIVTLQDAEGNEISHTGIQTISVVEKEFWDDIFPLEGGGHVHMKLHFILSEEERNRIRSMRDSAMKKKKQGKIPDTSLQYSETGTSVGGSVALSSNVNEDVSGITPNETVSIEDVATKASPLSNPNTLIKDSESRNQNKEEIIQNQTTPNATYRSEGLSSTPVTQEVDEHLTEVSHRESVGKLETHLPWADVSTRPIFGEGASSKFEFSVANVDAKSNPVSRKLDDDSSKKQEKQGSLQKTPNNVRKMISSFESTLAQEIRSPTKTPTSTSHLKRIGTEGPSKDQDSKHITNPAKASSGRLRNPFLTGDLQPEQTNVNKTGEHIDFDRYLSGTKSSQATGLLETEGQSKDLDLKDIRPSQATGMLKTEGRSKDQDLKKIIAPAETSSGSLRDPLIVDLQQTRTNVNKRGKHIGIDEDLTGTKPSESTGQLESSATHIQSERIGSSIENISKAHHKELNIKEGVKSHEDLMRTSTSKTATVSGRMDEEHSGRVQSYNLSAEQLDFEGTSVLEGRYRGTDSTNLHAVDIQGSSNVKLKSIEYCDYEQSSLQSSGIWIFPDNTRHLCMTTATKEIMNLLQANPNEAKTHQGKKSSSVPENAHKVNVTDAEMKKGEKKSHEPGKSGPESSADDASEGPVGQAIKIAIIVGFGVLVLFTRQRIQ